MNNFQITKIFESGTTNDPYDETLALIQEISSDINLDLIKLVHDQITRIFLGNDPEFKASNTEYHNLRHTCSVVLATARILHGLTIHNQTISARGVEQCIISAYFHDAGLLLKAVDTTQLGATYTKNHEKRSIRFLNNFLSEIGIDEEFRNVCATIIECTSLEVNPNTLTFVSTEAERSSWVVGTADILAQMADRYYLEQLPMLFNEKRVGGVNKHDSVAELMQQTTEFFNQDVIHRLEGVYHDIGRVIQSHFKQRWGVDQDLYRENISNNISYLRSILDDCKTELYCIEQYLRRTPPSSHIFQLD